MGNNPTRVSPSLSVSPLVLLTIVVLLAIFSQVFIDPVVGGELVAREGDESLENNLKCSGDCGFQGVIMADFDPVEISDDANVVSKRKPTKTTTTTTITTTTHQPTIPVVPSPPPDYPPHRPGRWGPFNPLRPVPGWAPLKIDEKVNYYEHHKHNEGHGAYVRSMCPALNTLANRGYIPRTGKNVTYEMFMDKIKEVFNFGEDNGLIVVETMFALYGYPPSVDLDMFGSERVQHLINCPAAPTREDREIGDNINLNWKYYKQLLQHSSDGGQTFTTRDFARHHHLRHNQSAKHNPYFKYGHRDAICSLAQYANIIGVLGRIGKNGLQTVYVEDVKHFYEKEDLPPKYNRRVWGYYSIEANTYIDRMANYIGFQPIRPYPPGDGDEGRDVEPIVAEFDKPCGKCL